MADRDHEMGCTSARTAAIAIALLGIVTTIVAGVAHAWSLAVVLTVLWPAAAMAADGGLDRLLEIAALPAQTFQDEVSA